MKIDNRPANYKAIHTFEEEERLEALRSYFILDTPPEEELDALTYLAAYTLKSRIVEKKAPMV